jgi:hypothetical protein
MEKKLGVSTRAIIQRINRKLKPDDEMLKAGRGRLAGRYYIINSRRNQIMNENVGLEALGRKLGALEAWEKVIP